MAHEARGDSDANGARCLRVASGIGTLVGCDNVEVGLWLDQARLAAVDGDVLVLIDETGAELGRLTRGPG